MKEILLLKCGELVLKGLNRAKFEQRLLRNLRYRLKPIGEYDVQASQSTIYVTPRGGGSVDEALEAVLKVFGVVTVGRAALCEKNIDAILQTAGEYLVGAIASASSFKVQAKRADKSFPMTSPQISAEVGGYLHDLFPACRPKMDDPEITVTVEVREQYAFVSGGKMPGAGGMPAGSNGRAMLLLSGGIDSPVAGYMMAKRGLELAVVHFESYPFTSQESLEKVVELARKLSGWCGRITVSAVPFARVQTEIRDRCQQDYSTILTRRMMMRVAQMVAQRQDCGALITGESLGQVASQTMESIAVTDNACTLPVFRPVIGMDKEEIVRIARKIDTYDTSVLPFEDCCTVFTPRHPQTKPRLENVLRQEELIDVDALAQEAFEGLKRITV